MSFEIKIRNMKGSEGIESYIEHRLSFTFSRMRQDIETATITVSDVNGPKGGVDKQCQIVLTPVGLPQIVISETREDLRQAIDRCLQRSCQALSRKLKRRQLLHRKPRQRLVFAGGPPTEEG